MLGELEPQSGGDQIPLLKQKLLIGRREECDICLRFPNVSSHHCELTFANGHWQVRDMNSSNGIKVNGIRVSRQWLFPGDELSVAKHRFKISYTPEGDPPPPLEEENTLGMSLMEKAGLVRRAAARGDDGASRPPQPAAPPKPAKPKEKDDDDRALDWLEDDA